MSYVVIILFIVGTIAGFSGYSDSSKWWTHISYIFAHVNVLHLVINSMAFFTLFKLLQQIVYKWWLLLIAFGVAIAGSYFASYSIDTKGASGVVYVLLGAFTWMAISDRIRFKQAYYNFVFAFGVIAGLAISGLNPSSNTALHLFCYLVGVLVFVVIDFSGIKGVYLKKRK